MMQKLTRAQAVERVGEKAVRRVETYNLEPTNRVCEKGLVEFSAETDCVEVTLRVYYYQDQEALDALDDNDMSLLDWTISHYTIV